MKRTVVVNDKRQKNYVYYTEREHLLPREFGYESGPRAAPSGAQNSIITLMVCRSFIAR